MNRREAGRHVAPYGAKASITHGVYHYDAHPVSQWPKALRQQFIAIFNGIMGLEHVTDADVHIAEQVARIAVLLNRAYVHITQKGLVDKDGRPAGILKPLVGMENTLRLGLRELGLTPAMRKQLRLDARGASWADALSVDDDAGEITDEGLEAAASGADEKGGEHAASGE